MIFLTSPNGVYIVDTETKEVIKLLNGNFFGIDEVSDTCVCVSGDGVTHDDRSIYFTERIFEGTKLHKYEYNIVKNELYFTNHYIIEKVRDVHQIAIEKDMFGRTIFLTNTKFNMVYSVRDTFDEYIDNFSYNNIVCDEDINHINAVYVDYNHCFYIGLNNKGNEFSEVIKHKICRECKHEDFDKIVLTGVYHSHDLEPYKDDILISASHQGFVYSLNKKEPLFYTGDVWTRGLAISEKGIWVGYSAVSPRSSRQDPSLKNSINLFSHGDFKHVQQIEIPGCGQINDLICIEDK